ncbi:hypothetical protein GCWU000324_01999 [Kingella oralis ATCC 51147]|uniref:Uncharacterized protein n=1 Tax=Kingella oralis ATCC 51147 TaxID=629741 RepID=C4GIX7_9NEIS|nr:hypothetical protein GCWU000324_01999 [Kingella oralis ATCC 51147]
MRRFTQLKFEATQSTFGRSKAAKNEALLNNHLGLLRHFPKLGNHPKTHLLKTQ